MGLLKDDILKVQTDMESIRQAVGILSGSLKNRQFSRLLRDERI